MRETQPYSFDDAAKERATTLISRDDFKHSTKLIPAKDEIYYLKLSTKSLPFCCKTSTRSNHMLLQASLAKCLKPSLEMVVGWLKKSCNAFVARELPQSEECLIFFYVIFPN